MHFSPGLYFEKKIEYRNNILSTISEQHNIPGESERIVVWRNVAASDAEKLPHRERYGIGIDALSFPEDVSFSGRVDYHVDASKELEVYTWSEAMAQEETRLLVEELLSSPLLPGASFAFAARGRAMFRDALVVYVQPKLDEKGESAFETLTLTSTLPGETCADLLVVIVKNGARIDMKSVVTGGSPGAGIARTTIVLAEGEALIRFAASGGVADGVTAMDSFFLVGPHARVEWVEDPKGARAYRSSVRASLLGIRSSAQVLHVLLSGSDAIVDVNAEVRHCASETDSRVFALGLASENSRTVYRGNIAIAPGVSDVDGAQDGRFLLVSPAARVDAIPALDIASKEVRSSHRLFVTHIRPADLFYAVSRGITPLAARLLTIEGFFGTLLHKVNKEELLTELEPRIADLVPRE